VSRPEPDRAISPTVIRLCRPSGYAGREKPSQCRVRCRQETTVPKSRVRKKSVYTPPPRTAKAKFSPPWLAPTMLASLLIGLAWIAAYYISGGSLPGLGSLGAWNLVIGFGFIIFGVALSTKWR
jgi:Cell division protein CrgA